MLHITKEEFMQWERFYRANMLNSISGFKATHLIATVNADGLPNLSLFHNIVHLGADPALIGMVSRPRAASPHTLSNIESTGWWTLNSVHASFIERAHQCSAKYPDGVNEFDEVGLTAEVKGGFPVPVVAESAIQYALKLVEMIPITHNNTYFIIGSIEQFWVDESLLLPDGLLRLDKVEVVTSTGLDAYYTTQPLARLGYAKPHMPSPKLEQ